MSTQLASEVTTTTRSLARVYVLSGLGPATALAGVLWAIVQPYRLTLLHPHGQGFWWLLVEPPLLAVAVGVVFALFVAPGVIEDLEAEER